MLRRALYVLCLGVLVAATAAGQEGGTLVEVPNEETEAGGEAAADVTEKRPGKSRTRAASVEPRQPRAKPEHEIRPVLSDGEIPAINTGRGDDPGWAILIQIRRSHFQHQSELLLLDGPGNELG